ncbi:hypothetical protein NQZ68_037987 [Dissostichus eleginoides]|nr:hypothetical protein NQZ68_037987 [Dissostichus eleginoides]
MRKVDVQAGIKASHTESRHSFTRRDHVLSKHGVLIVETGRKNDNPMSPDCIPSLFAHMSAGQQQRSIYATSRFEHTQQMKRKWTETSVPDSNHETVAPSSQCLNWAGTHRPDTVVYVTSGIWNYTLTMKAFMDARRTLSVTPNTELRVNQKVWFELKADGLDEKKVSLLTESCYATSDPSPSTHLKYDLIRNGCANPSDNIIVIESNGQGLTNYFSFNMFQFNGNSKDIYLHCRMNLCLKSDNSCTRSCGQGASRRRSYRNKLEGETDSIIIMAWEVGSLQVRLGTPRDAGGWPPGSSDSPLPRQKVLRDERTSA